MHHARNFPPIPSAQGVFFGNEALKGEVLERIAETPDKYFIRGQYARPRSVVVRTAEDWGIKKPPSHFKGCAVMQLAFGGIVAENIGSIDVLSEHSSLAMDTVKILLRDRYAFIPELTQAISSAYEAVGDKLTLFRIVDAIPVGATDSLYVALRLYERARARNESIRRDKLLIRAFAEHVHFARAISSHV